MTLLNLLWICGGTWSPEMFSARWPDELLVWLAAVTALAGLARQLPLQNVVLASSIVLLLSLSTQLLAGFVGLNFHPQLSIPHIHPDFSGYFYWSTSASWLVAVVASRGTAQLIVRDQNQPASVGWMRLIWGAVLMGLFFGGLALMRQPNPPRVEDSWAALMGFCVHWLTGFLAGLFSMVLIAPALLKKKPGPRQAERDWLLLWALPAPLVLTGFWMKQWWVGAAGLSLTLVWIGFLALRPSRNSTEDAAELPLN